MKRIIFFISLFLSFSVWADILLSPKESFVSSVSYKLGSMKCFGKTPLYDGENCYSCNEPKTLASGNGMKCEEICPNRYSTYECGPSCVLRNPPNDSYEYVECKGWVKKEFVKLNTQED